MSVRDSLLLGVDGGGQTTQAVIATLDGEIVGRGLGLPSNYHRVGLEAAGKAIRTAIEGAFSQVLVSRGGPRMLGSVESWREGTIQSACLGLAGVDSPDDELVISSWLAGIGCRFQTAIVNDSELILGGGTPQGWGVALVSGTGSVCFGRTSRGRSTRVGGWGHVLGDEGAGYLMATEALRAATQAADKRGGSPALLQAALAHWRLESPAALIGMAYNPATTAEDIAGFGVRVIELAAKRETTAFEIVSRAASALALHVDTVAKELSLTRPALALGGSMMRASFKKMILDRIAVPMGEATIVADPLRGAVLMARRLAQPAYAA
jgi:N-acetylglucosamine kinase-like BadF-type ATPase